MGDGGDDAGMRIEVGSDVAVGDDAVTEVDGPETRREFAAELLVEGSARRRIVVYTEWASFLPDRILAIEFPDTGFCSA